MPLFYRTELAFYFKMDKMPKNMELETREQPGAGVVEEAKNIGDRAALGFTEEVNGRGEVHIAQLYVVSQFA